MKLTAPPYFLLLGGNDPRKNAACAIIAFEELQKTAAVHLIVIGTCQTASSHVSYIDRPADEALATLMRNAAALLYPSWYEGFGLPLHEAASYGTPILASTAGALPDTAPLGTVFIPPFKPHLWVQAMRLALARPTPTHSPLPADWSAAGRIAVKSLRRSVAI